MTPSMSSPVSVETFPAFFSPDPVCRSLCCPLTPLKVTGRARVAKGRSAQLTGSQNSRARRAKAKAGSLLERPRSPRLLSRTTGRTTGSPSSGASNYADVTAEAFVPIPNASSFTSVRSKAAIRTAQPASTAKPTPEPVQPLIVWRRRWTAHRSRTSPRIACLNHSRLSASRRGMSHLCKPPIQCPSKGQRREPLSQQSLLMRKPGRRGRKRRPFRQTSPQATQ